MRWLFAFLLCSVASAARAQLRDFSGGHFATPPVLDGAVGTEEYRDAVRFEGLVDSDTGQSAAEGGTFYLAYDAKYVYFAARLVDLHPNSIQATEYRTNVNLDGNDTVALSLDPFGKLTDFNQFTMNARGATNLQIAGGRAPKREWLGDFAAKGRVTPEGWEVEARIPWSVMRLPGKGPHDLRFNVYRNHRRLQRYYAWAQTNNGLIQNFGRWKTVDLPNPPVRALQMLPYLYGGLDEKTGIVANAGIDLRYPLTRDLDLVGTISPDFRNIERSVLSLDFSYFDRLADENRPFFLEGQEYFGVYESPIFASQQIHTFDAGAKVFGKLNAQTDIGVLATADFGNDQAIVARAHRKIDPLTDASVQYAGGSVDGRRNDALFASYSHGSGNWSYTGKMSATQDDKEGTGHSAILNSFYGQGRAFAFFRYAEVTDNFVPRLGFAPQTDFRGVNSYGAQNWVDLKRGLVSYGIEGGFTYQRSYDFDRPFHEGGEVYPNFTLKDGSHFYAILAWDRYFGNTGDQTYGGSLERPAGDPYRHWNLTYQEGTRAGSFYRNASAGFSYRPLPTFQLGANHQTSTYLGDTFDQSILSANYDLDQYHSVGARAVASPGGTNWYLSFRQSGNRGAEYYLILGDPNATQFRASIILKAVFPFSLKI